MANRGDAISVDKLWKIFDLEREKAWEGVDSPILEDGSLILLDECGNCVPCPSDRFEIRRRPPEGEEDT